MVAGKKTAGDPLLAAESDIDAPVVARSSTLLTAVGTSKTRRESRDAKRERFSAISMPRSVSKRLSTNEDDALTKQPSCEIPSESGSEKKSRVLVDLTKSREDVQQLSRPVVDLTAGRLSNSNLDEDADTVNLRSKERKLSGCPSVLSFATVPEHMLKNVKKNSWAVNIPSAPPTLTKMVNQSTSSFGRMKSLDELNEDDVDSRLNAHEFPAPSQCSMGSHIKPIEALKGPRGEFYDPSAVRFFYGKRWSDGMCDAVGKPLNMFFCITPCSWPFLLSSAAVRARPLIFGTDNRYLQITSPCRMRLTVLAATVLSLCFFLGIMLLALTNAIETTMPRWDPLATIVAGSIIVMIGLVGPVLWGLVFVAIRNRYQVRESVWSTFFKAICVPCLFVLRVKRHVDQAQGFMKPKGMLQEALCATSDSQTRWNNQGSASSAV